MLRERPKYVFSSPPVSGLNSLLSSGSWLPVSGWFSLKHISTISLALLFHKDGKGTKTNSQETLEEALCCLVSTGDDTIMLLLMKLSQERKEK